MTGKKMVAIGRITGAHGVKGEFNVHPLTDFPERFLDMERLDVYRPDGRFLAHLNLTGIRSHVGKGVFIAEAEGVTDRDRAESLKGLLVQVSPDERVALPEGAVWVDDIIGLEVRTESGERLGEVIDVMPTGAHDLYEVERPAGGRGMIPAVSQVVLDIDVEAGFMTVRLPEGLWE